MCVRFSPMWQTVSDYFNMNKFKKCSRAPSLRERASNIGNKDTVLGTCVSSGWVMEAREQETMFVHDELEQCKKEEESRALEEYMNEKYADKTVDLIGDGNSLMYPMQPLSTNVSSVHDSMKHQYYNHYHNHPSQQGQIHIQPTPQYPPENVSQYSVDFYGPRLGIYLKLLCDRNMIISYVVGGFTPDIPGYVQGSADRASRARCQVGDVWTHIAGRALNSFPNLAQVAEWIKYQPRPITVIFARYVSQGEQDPVGKSSNDAVIILDDSSPVKQTEDNTTVHVDLT